MPYSTIQFNIKQGDYFYEYCDDITHAASNLRNAALFRLRQVYTLVNKPIDKLTQNELEVYNEILRAVKEFPEICYIPAKKKYKLSYRYLDKLMRVNDNPDFFDKRLPKQTSQQVLKGVIREM
ncbi:MAG: hypothetical protein LUG46_03115, partial [Erysipelotrichaceae bacterium]|nr:hypothetical protein [Erysipelotrichaceae bacterium]